MGTLHVVATPIGNLEDVTLRALRILGEADLVFAEDTRRTRILLQRHGVEARPLSLHAHNERSRIEGVLEALEAGRSVAMVSDAGTPLVSDPGERLVAAALSAGHRVEAIPGASAVLAALAVSGLRAQPFAFLGFLPRRGRARRVLLDSYRGRPETLVVFESPRRLTATLRDLAEVWGDRSACVARELTKLHEESRRGSLSSLADETPERVRGEVTIVVEGADPSLSPSAQSADAPDSLALDDRIRSLLEEGRRPREIAAALAAETGLPRRELYARAVRAQGVDRDEGADAGRDAEGAT